MSIFSNSFSGKPQSIYELFEDKSSNGMSLPPFQRHYIGASSGRVTEIIGSILDCTKAYQDTLYNRQAGEAIAATILSSTMLGSSIEIILKDTASHPVRKNVLDGQQRLTTFSLFFAVVVEYLMAFNKEIPKLSTESDVYENSENYIYHSKIIEQLIKADLIPPKMQDKTPWSDAKYALSAAILRIIRLYLRSTEAHTTTSFIDSAYPFLVRGDRDINLKHKAVDNGRDLYTENGYNSSIAILLWSHGILSFIINMYESRGDFSEIFTKLETRVALQDNINKLDSLNLHTVHRVLKILETVSHKSMDDYWAEAKRKNGRNVMDYASFLFDMFLKSGDEVTRSFRLIKNLIRGKNESDKPIQDEEGNTKCFTEYPYTEQKSRRMCQEDILNGITFLADAMYYVSRYVGVIAGNVEGGSIVPDFQLYQTLNSQSTPLTPIDMFLSDIVEDVQLTNSIYVGSEQMKLIEFVRYTISKSANPSAMEYNIINHVVRCLDSSNTPKTKQVSNLLASLKDSYTSYQRNTNKQDGGLGFIRMLADVAYFLDNEWCVSSFDFPKYEQDKGQLFLNPSSIATYFNKLHLKADIARVSLTYLRETKTIKLIPILYMLINRYTDFATKSDEDGDLTSAIKMLVAFVTLFRGCQNGTKNIPAAFDRILEEMVVSRIQSLTLDKFSSILKNELTKSVPESVSVVSSDWVNKAKDKPFGDGELAFTKFFLIVSRDECEDYRNKQATQWLSFDTFQRAFQPTMHVDHIAPKELKCIDKDAYDSWNIESSDIACINWLGNLTILSGGINISKSNDGPKRTSCIYNALAENDMEKAKSLLQENNESEKLIAAIEQDKIFYRFSSDIYSYISKNEMNSFDFTQWTTEQIEKRTIDILNRVHSVMTRWLNGDPDVA